jgi:dihydrofolate synthase/folylpolyglutamate synthase
MNSGTVSKNKLKSEAEINADKIKAHLFSLVSKGIKYDLKRITDASSLCGNAFTAYKTFHVAGTNGKGSTCAYIESVLRHNGFRTGLFTSPHILKFEERFQINGKPVTQEKWLNVYFDLKDIIEAFNLTFFEATSLIAFELFKRNKVDWAVFETGLGGRLDATNVITPEVSIITSISMDHMDLLGNDILSIAGEKLGIVKKGVPLVAAWNQNENVIDLINKTCSERNCSCTIVSTESVSEINIDENGTSFFKGGRLYKTPLKGKYQILNLLVAIEALSKAGIKDYNAIISGIENTGLPGRFQEFIINGKNVVFDVGHNPDAARVLVNCLQDRFPGKSVCIITGIMKDKDVAGVLEKYSEIAERIILTKPDIPRAQSTDLLLAAVPEIYRSKCIVIENVADAVKAGLAYSEQVLCIAGSFYTVSEAFKFAGIDPYMNADLVT